MERRKPPRLLIEEWLPAAAIGVECMREEGSLTAKPPTKYFHVWWARRPLTVSTYRTFYPGEQGKNQLGWLGDQETQGRDRTGSELPGRNFAGRIGMLLGWRDELLRSTWHPPRRCATTEAPP